MAQYSKLALESENLCSTPKTHVVVKINWLLYVYDGMCLQMHQYINSHINKSISKYKGNF